MERIYGIHIDNPHSKNGIRKSLAKIRDSSSIIVPDPSIIPSASIIYGKRKLTALKKQIWMKL